MSGCFGFTEEANRDLIDEDASFFGDIPSSDASASDSADGTIALDTTHLPVGSDDEEDLDEYDQGQSEPATALAAAAVGRDKQPAIKLSSTEDIEARRVAGCPCAGSQNCSLSVPPEIIKSARNSTEVLGDDARRVFLSGKLDALANRGDSGHHEAHHAARSRVTYWYEVGGVKTCQAVFLYANSASRYDVHQVQAHLDAGVLTTPQHGNVGRFPWNAVSAVGVTQVRDFIRNNTGEWSPTTCCAQGAQHSSTSLLARHHYKEAGAPEVRRCRRHCLLPDICETMVERNSRCFDYDSERR